MAQPKLTGLRQAVFAQLVASADILAALPKYRGKPAIFTNWIVPADAPVPRIVIENFVAGASDDTTTSSERMPSLEIYIYGSAKVTTASPTAIDDLAETVRSVLHNADPHLSGWTCIKSTASGPVTAPTDENFVGRLITMDYWFSQAN